MRQKLRILVSSFFLLSIAPSCFMEEDLNKKKSTSSTLPWPLVGTGEAIEIVGPRDFKALSGDLVLWTRLSPLVFNLSGTLDQTFTSQLSMQLFLVLQEQEQTLLSTQPVPLPLTTSWEQVTFPCNIIVQGGLYTVRLVHEENSKVLSNITIQAFYPTIVFDVPRRIEAYTTATRVTFGLTKSPGCEPKRSLLPTVLTLSICSPEEVPTSILNEQEPLEEEGNDYIMMGNDKDCSRDFATLMENPLSLLQKEGSITTAIECHLWARNATFRLQLREKESRVVIAKSRPIRVEWGSQFSINITKPTVMPCRRFVQAFVSYPTCILPGRDKIRVYGHETLSVPSLLVPNRLSYIGEHKIQQNAKDVRFKCSLFPQRFLRFCFQYINTAMDESVDIVMEKCIPTNPPLKLRDGGWGPWSSWTPCTLTCGHEGRRYRYRFCDNPIPSSGANFCQGESIQERGCDTLPECQGFDSSSEEEDLYEDETEDGMVPHTHHHRHHPQVQNVTITPGCECGCILYDLVPERNDTLVIFISSNFSSTCADEDEVDHHKFKWILHAKDDRDRIRLDIVEMEVQCVTITFRDGNTSDSNLLRVIASQDYQHEHETQLESHYDNLSQKEEEEDPELLLLTLVSTGSSLSISAFDSNTRNCSGGEFIYFIAYYTTIPERNSTFALTASEDPGSSFSTHYQFWTFIMIKLTILFFLLVIILSGFGGCLTKVYRKEKYKELKGFDNEDEGGGGGSGSCNPEGREDDISRCTSVTLMSFDYSYWRQMRLLRLKYFLLKPRPLPNISSKVMSFPTTPNKSRPGNPNPNKEPNPTGSRKSKSNHHPGESYRLSKSISLSETNLRLEKPWESTKMEGKGALVTKSQRRKHIHPTRIPLNESQTTMSISSSVTPTPSPIPGIIATKKKKRLRDIGKSQMSISTQSCSSAREMEDADQDFEMDYYDYDVMNAGNIPGSYLGLEPAFVLWSSDVYNKEEEEEETEGAKEGTEHDHLLIPMSKSNASNATANSEDIEMTATTVSSSLGIFSQDSQYSMKKNMAVKETSLDTLKFADDEDTDVEEDCGWHET